MSEKETRIELLSAIQSASAAIPQMRVGQLIAAIGELCSDLHGRGLWDADDAELLEAAWQFQRNFESAISPARATIDQAAEPAVADGGSK